MQQNAIYTTTAEVTKHEWVQKVLEIAKANIDHFIQNCSLQYMYM